ncbi:ASH1-related protein 2 [Artemisia annua]|uniref:ASH1-related protein 2 n=1 Tax=Artemisia annua TaxID=35608 RepID=A0A2U1PMK6_ARTAN|nr:ASH1-related protein 2 [Artemisia annua]
MEICLSCFPVNLRYGERQKRLKDDYELRRIGLRVMMMGLLWMMVTRMWERMRANMDEDVDEEMDGEGEDGSAVNGGDDDFPHAYFFVNFICERESCGGTLAPLPPSATTSNGVMECHVCGSFKKLDQGEVWGTLAPLPPSATTSNGVMECHVCGSFKKLDQDAKVLEADIGQSSSRPY